MDGLRGRSVVGLLVEILVALGFGPSHTLVRCVEAMPSVYECDLAIFECLRIVGKRKTVGMKLSMKEDNVA
jgi:hypothetical protein